MRSADRVVTRLRRVAISVGMDRVPRKVWAKRVERWRESGQTAMEYAVAHGLNPDRLRYWGWQLAKAARGEAAATVGSAAKREESTKTGTVVPFIEVQRRPAMVVEKAESSTAPAEPIEIVAPNGLRVRVPARFDQEALRRVLAAVR
jgi:hypothetical protein